MAAFVELYVDQGTTFSSVITLTDDVTGENLDITGYTVRSQMRRSYYSANASANLYCALTNPAQGEVTLSLSSGVTANIKAGRYLFDVETTDQANNVVRVVEGIITVTPRITR